MNTDNNYEWYCNEGNVKEFIDFATKLKDYISIIKEGDHYSIASLKNELNTYIVDIPEISTAISDINKAYKKLEETEKSYDNSLLLADEIITQTKKLEADTNGNISIAKDEFNDIVKSFNKKFEIDTNDKDNIGLAFATSFAIDSAVKAIKNQTGSSSINNDNKNNSNDSKSIKLPKTGLANAKNSAVEKYIDINKEANQNKNKSDKKSTTKSDEETKSNSISKKSATTITKSGTKSKSSSKKTKSIKTGSVVTATGVVGSKAVKKASEKVLKKYNPKPSTIEKDIYVSKPDNINKIDDIDNIFKPNTDNNINKPTIPDIINPDNNQNISNPSTPPTNNTDNPINNQVTPPTIKPDDTEQITTTPPVSNNPNSNNNSNNSGLTNMGSSNNPTVNVTQPTTNNNSIGGSSTSTGGGIVYKKGYTPPASNKPNNNIVGTTTDSTTGVVTEKVDIPDTKTDLFETDPDIKDYIDIGADRTTSSSTGSGIGILPITGGLAATAAIGAGIKIYKDRKENNDFDDSEDRLSNENKFWTEEEANVRHSEKEIYNDENSNNESAYKASNNDTLNNDTWSMEEDIINSANTQIDLLEN